jgi:hypothetical protein
MSKNGLIRYYRECFKEDSGDFNLRNLLRLKQEDLLFIKGQDDIATANLPRLPIVPNYGESFSKRIEIYQRERVLLYGSLFIAGKLVVNDEVVSLFSPLVTNEAKMESDEYGYYFTVDHSLKSVNEELLSLLLPDYSDLPAFDDSRLYDPTYWIEMLEKSPYELHCLDSLRFPALGSKDDATKAMRRKAPSLLPISCLAFVERSASSRGILHELSLLSEQKKQSVPINALLGDSTSQSDHNEFKVNHRLVPGTLSAAQKRVLEMAANQPLSVVSGPPGTGKSFTIAAVAAEHFTRGQSVLIVAHTDTALDVIANKLSQNFGLDNLYVRVGLKSVLKEFKQYLDDLLAGYFDHSEAVQSAKYKKQLDELIKAIENDENDLKKISASAFKSGTRAHRVREELANLWDKVLYKLSSLSVGKESKLWQISAHFNQLIEQKESLSTKYLRAEKARIISSLLKSDRKQIQTLNKASRARTSSKQSEYFSNINFDSLLKGFPVWLVTLNTLHKVLPLKNDLFDLVIVDEATQCNIASALPACARASRALIMGDQKQLRHFSFLARAKQVDIAEQYDVKHSDKTLSYRDQSILDLAFCSVEGQSQVAFLDEHFRSQPELINFSNELFYNKKLKIMQHRPCSTTGHMHIVDVNGERDKAGFNSKEADAIVEKINTIINQDIESNLPRSIGVLSPFSKQVNHLSEQIEKQLSLDAIKAHNLKVSTPFGFQGEERDIMLLSFCIDNDSRRAAAYLNKEDVFNVSVTRARQTQIIYKSVDQLSLPADNLLRKYLASVEAFTIEHKSEKQPDKFQEAVITELKALDIPYWRGYEMLGTYIDILVKTENKYIAIDLIGYPGPWGDYFELSTYKVIKRAGIEVFPVTYALWVKDKQACLQALKHALKA